MNGERQEEVLLRSQSTAAAPRLFFWHWTAGWALGATYGDFVTEGGEGVAEVCGCVCVCVCVCVFGCVCVCVCGN